MHFTSSVWFCFSRVLQDDLNKVRNHWYSHKISKSAYSAIECAISVSEEQTKEMEVHYHGEVEDSPYEEYFEYVLKTESWVYPCTVKGALYINT